MIIWILTETFLCRITVYVHCNFCYMKSDNTDHSLYRHSESLSQQCQSQVTQYILNMQRKGDASVNRIVFNIIPCLQKIQAVRNLSQLLQFMAVTFNIHKFSTLTQYRQDIANKTLTKFMKYKLHPFFNVSSFA